MCYGLAINSVISYLIKPKTLVWEAHRANRLSRGRTDSDKGLLSGLDFDSEFWGLNINMIW